MYLNKEKFDETKLEENKKSNNVTGSGVENAQPKEEEVKQTPLQEALEFKEKGNECFGNRKYKQAIAFYNSAIESCPSSAKVELAIFYNNRAAANEKLNKISMVKKDCTRSIDYNPLYVKAYKRRAKAYEACGEMSICIDDAIAICILENFKNVSSIKYADRILDMIGFVHADSFTKKRKPTLLSNVIIKYSILRYMHDPVLSKDLPETVMDASAAQGYVRAKKALKEHRYEDIIPACNEQLALAESGAQYKSEALLLRGIFHMFQAAYDQAKDDFEEIIKNKNVDKNLRAYAYAHRAELHIEEDDERDLALADLKEAERLSSNPIDIIQQRGRLYYMRTMLPEAIAQFERVLQLKSDHATAYVMKTHAEYKAALSAKNYMGAMELFQKLQNCVKKFPNSFDCFFTLGHVFLSIDFFEPADRCYARAIQLAPDNANFHLMRAILQIDMEKFDFAAEILQHAIELDPKCTLAIETLGRVEFERGNFDCAAQLFESATQFARNHADRCTLFTLHHFVQSHINIKKKFNIKVSPDLEKLIKLDFNAKYQMLKQHNNLLYKNVNRKYIVWDM